MANEGFVEGSNSWDPSGTKTTPTQVKSEAQQELASKSKTCFKCQGLGILILNVLTKKRLP